MRRGCLRAVSSALLLLSLVFMPHPSDLLARCADAGVTPMCYGLHISEFYPCALANDEYFTISNDGDFNVDLKSWSITDGEGALYFIADLWLNPGKAIAMSWNTSSYWSAYDRYPDVSLDLSDLGTIVNLSGTLRLADSGDSLALRSPTEETVDFVCYGATNETSPGWSGPSIACLKKGEVAKRIKITGNLLDTDSCTDWQPFREFRYGYTEFAREDFQILAGGMTAFTSPDCSLDVIVNSLEHAKDTVSLCSYEFSSVPLCEAILRAAARGVQVSLLVDGSPAGSMKSEEASCMSVLSMAGCKVLVTNGNMSRHAVQHIDALHAKYMVIDNACSIVMSENFVEQGVPSDRLFGNRGWGVLISNVELAAYLQRLFDSDSRMSRGDVINWRLDGRFDQDAILPSLNKSTHSQGIIGPFRSTAPSSVTVLPSPDTSLISPFLCDSIRSCRSMTVEQFQTDLYWESRWTGVRHRSPLVQSVLDAANRGADVRGILDSTWFNLERNGQVLECLRENVSFPERTSFRFMDQRSPISTLHNKGAVFDGNRSLVSSNNWVFASFARNRELSVMIASAEIASFYGRAFDLDWYPDVMPPTVVATPDLKLTLGHTIVLSANGSTDDRAIASVAWDINADGTIDSRNSVLQFNATSLGNHTIVVRVTDAWGNLAVHEVHVIVLPASTNDGVARIVSSGSCWLLPICIGILSIFLRLLKQRDPGGSRNFNHRPRS